MVFHLRNTLKTRLFSHTSGPLTPALSPDDGGEGAQSLRYTFFIENIAFLRKQPNFLSGQPVTFGGDGTVDGSTSEDRFFGFSNDAGISRLVISMSNSTDWEVDHLQYGRLVPEPNSLSAASLLVFASGWFRPRRRSA